MTICDNCIHDAVCGLEGHLDDALTFCANRATGVQPIRRGRWIELPKALNPNENPCKCSNCGHVLSFMNYYPKSKYCPNCNADMRDVPDTDVGKIANTVEFKERKECEKHGSPD